MSVSIRMAETVTPLSVGLQTITVPTWSETPKAAMLIVNLATTNGVMAAHSNMCFGITDGTIASGKKELAALYKCRNGVTPTYTQRRLTDLACIVIFGTDGTTAIDAQASLDAFVVGGLRLNWTNVLTQESILKCIFFAGSDLLVSVGSFLPSATVNGTVVATPGFPVDQVIALAHGSTNLNGTSSTGAIRIGFVDRGPPIVNHSLNMLENFSVPASDGSARVSTLYMNSTPLGSAGLAITNFSATDFTVTSLVAGSSTRTLYLALGYQGTVPHSVLMVDSPTVALPGVAVNVGYKPQFVLQATNTCDVVDSQRTTSEDLAVKGAGVVGITAFTATEIGTMSTHQDDGSNPAIARSYAHNKLSVWPDNVSGVLLEATFNSFNGTDYKLDYTAVSSVVRKWPTLIIGEVPTPPVAGPIPVMQNSYRQRRT